MAESVPVDFAWVTARSACSLAIMFKQLELGAEQDAKTMQSLVPANNETRFSIVGGSNKQFSVMRVDDPITSIARSVEFRLEQNEITVSYRHQYEHELLFSAEITLTDEGRCKFKVGDKELEQWQLRRKALEKLFFR